MAGRITRSVSGKMRKLEEETVASTSALSPEVRQEMEEEEEQYQFDEEEMIEMGAISGDPGPQPDSDDDEREPAIIPPPKVPEEELVECGICLESCRLSLNPFADSMNDTRSDGLPFAMHIGPIEDRHTYCIGDLQIYISKKLDDLNGKMFPLACPGVSRVVIVCWECTDAVW